MRVHLILGPADARRACAAPLCALYFWCALAGAPGAHANALNDAQLLRQSGCAGVMAAQRPLQHIDALDATAARWASGRSLGSAAARSSYTAEQLAGLHVTGSDDAVLQTLRRSGCGTLMRADLGAIGVYQRGADAWFVFATMRRPPPATGSIAFAARVLDLVNAARSRSTSCGGRAFAPAPPLRLSTTLAVAARAHATDMAEHEYFEHRDLDGHTPADRVRATGYGEKLVGENIAYGPQSAEEVVRGWLDSPGHCENIMDARFAEMGIAYAFGRAPAPASGRGLYWVQVLADPKERSADAPPSFGAGGQ